MQRWKRVAGGGLSAIYGLKRNFTGTPQGLRILMYHSIGSRSPDELNDLYTVTPLRFKSQLSFLRSQQLDSAFKIHPFTEMAQTGISITFDDGYRDNLEIAAPLLLEYGFSFHVFVNPSFVLSKDHKYLTIQSLEELAKLPGVSIGAHGYSHKKLTECTPTELAYELYASKQWIENVIGREVKTMAFPHGAVNDEVKKAAANAGYTIAASSKFGMVTLSSDSLALERTDIWSSDNARSFRSKLHGNWDWMNNLT